MLHGAFNWWFSYINELTGFLAYQRKNETILPASCIRFLYWIISERNRLNFFYRHWRSQFNDKVVLLWIRTFIEYWQLIQNKMTSNQAKNSNNSYLEHFQDRSFSGFVSRLKKMQITIRCLHHIFLSYSFSKKKQYIVHPGSFLYNIHFCL